MRLIGITGGVGAGKTEILAYIKRHYRCEIYLADQVAHAVKEPGQPCYEPLRELLGGGILGPDGRIDRAAMAALIFTDGELLRRVNEIVHPAVIRFLLDKVEEARRGGVTELFFIEAALLIEAGFKELVDELWYIHADECVRRKRLGGSRGYSPDKITGIMEKQLSESEFRSVCDFVIDNNGPLEDSYQQINRKLEAFTWQS